MSFQISIFLSIRNIRGFAIPSVHEGFSFSKKIVVTVDITSKPCYHLSVR